VRARKGKWSKEGEKQRRTGDAVAVWHAIMGEGESNTVLPSIPHPFPRLMHQLCAFSTWRFTCPLFSGAPLLSLSLSLTLTLVLVLVLEEIRA